MTSQLDLDQGGTFRQWQKAYLGPSVGWINVPLQNILPIIATGTYNIDTSTSLVTINTASSVTIILPTVLGSTGGVQAQPGRYALNPITIVDIGGNAATFPTTIQPFPGENIMSLSSLPLSTNFGGYTLAPNATLHGWNSISP
jgi:hypothetical protein